MIKIGNFDFYKRYTGTIYHDSYKGLYFGQIDGNGLEYCGNTLDGLYSNFKTIVELKIQGEMYD